MESEGISQALSSLADLMEISHEELELSSGEGNDLGFDALVTVGSRSFALEYKVDGGLASVRRIAEQVQRYSDAMSEHHIPLIVVPFMSEFSRPYLKDLGISWLDLSGNAHIKSQDLLLRVEGRPDKFKSPGRPSSPYSPKASRVARHLLLTCDSFSSQSEISQAVGVSMPYLSRIVSRFKSDRLLEWNEEGGLRVKDPDLMLQAWREDYRFSKHRIIKGHIPARSSEQLVLKVGQLMRERGVKCVATGLGAAWMLTRWASFRTATFYVDDVFPKAEFEKLGFRQEERGANVWLVQPNDSGVFYKQLTRRKVDLVHPVQIYLDLKGHPERSKEAAEQLRLSKFFKTASLDYLKAGIEEE